MNWASSRNPGLGVLLMNPCTRAQSKQTNSITLRFWLIFHLVRDALDVICEVGFDRSKHFRVKGGPHSGPRRLLGCRESSERINRQSVLCHRGSRTVGRQDSEHTPVLRQKTVHACVRGAIVCTHLTALPCAISWSIFSPILRPIPCNVLVMGGWDHMVRQHSDTPRMLVENKTSCSTRTCAVHC